MNKQKEITIVHESYAASLANDITSFAFLILVVWANEHLLRSGIPDLAISFLFAMFLLSKLSFAKKRVFTSKEQADEFIAEFYGEGDE